MASLLYLFFLPPASLLAVYWSQTQTSKEREPTRKKKQTCCFKNWNMILGYYVSVHTFIQLAM